MFTFGKSEIESERKLLENEFIVERVDGLYLCQMLIVHFGYLLEHWT